MRGVRLEPSYVVQEIAGSWGSNYSSKRCCATGSLSLFMGDGLRLGCCSRTWSSSHFIISAEKIQQRFYYPGNPFSSTYNSLLKKWLIQFHNERTLVWPPLLIPGQPASILESLLIQCWKSPGLLECMRNYAGSSAAAMWKIFPKNHRCKRELRGQISTKPTRVNLRATVEAASGPWEPMCKLSSTGAEQLSPPRHRAGDS